MARINPTVSEDAREDAIKQIERLSSLISLPITRRFIVCLQKGQSQLSKRRAKPRGSRLAGRFSQSRKQRFLCRQSIYHHRKSRQ